VIRRALGWQAAAGFLAAAACFKPAPAPSQASSEPYCKDTEVPLGDAGVGALDPAEFVRRAQAAYRRDVVWKNDLHTVHHLAEGKSTTLELALAAQGPVRRIRSQAVYPPVNGPRELSGLICAEERLELPVTGRVKTSDGLIDERFATKLVLAPDPMARKIQASLVIPMPLGAFRGSFRISAREPAERQGGEVFFWFWLDPNASLRGIMGGTFAHGDEATLERFFCLPDDQCY
jgi:hypothetical protein